MAAATKEFSILGLIWRFVGSLILVLATYNPSGVSYYHWVREYRELEGGSLGPEHFVVGMLLVIGWAVMFVAAQRSLGTVGMILGAALIAGVVWLLADFGIMSVDSVSALTWIVLIGLALLLSVGLAWSHLWRRLTGQYEVDDD